MNPRERMLAIGVLGVVILGGAVFLFHLMVLGPLDERELNITSLRKDVENKQDRVRQIQADQPRLERWRQLSLPPDPEIAQREYEKYLSGMLQESGIPIASVTVTPKQPDTKSSPVIQGKGPIYTKLDYTVKLNRVTLANLVTAMERFYRTGLFHQIKNLSIQRPVTTGAQQRIGDLDVTLTVEALIVNGVPKRNYLMPGLGPRTLALEMAAFLRGAPTGLALVPWAIGPTGPLGPGVLAEPARQYAAIAAKNIFYGSLVAPEQPRDETDVTRYVRLTDISRNDRRTEGWLYDRYNKKFTRLRPDRGFDSFTVRDSQNAVLFQGKVLRMEGRDMIFRVESKIYTIHVGQTIEEAMKKELAPEKLRELGLAPKGEQITEAKQGSDLAQTPGGGEEQSQREAETAK
jgi:hypothetical protein